MCCSLDATDLEATRQLRRQLMSGLRDVATPESDLDAASIILSELLGNVQKHAPGMAEVCVEWTTAAPTLVVRDFGRGFRFAPQLPHASSETGRGLYLVWSLAEDVRVTRHADGTRVCVRLPLRRRAHIEPIEHVHAAYRAHVG